MPASQINGIFIMLIGIGALLMLIGVIVFFKMRGPSGDALMAEGVVVDQEEYDSDGVTYSPIVKFTAHDGTEITFTDAVASYPALFKVGEQVKVRYDPKNFRNARIASSIRSHLTSIVILVLGGILLTVGLVCRR
jgi:hypothetical protein